MLVVADDDTRPSCEYIRLQNVYGLHCHRELKVETTFKQTSTSTTANFALSRNTEDSGGEHRAAIVVTRETYMMTLPGPRSRNMKQKTHNLAFHLSSVVLLSPPVPPHLPTFRDRIQHNTCPCPPPLRIEKNHADPNPLTYPSSKQPTSDGPLRRRLMPSSCPCS